jgi:hypothetical protein
MSYHDYFSRLTAKAEPPCDWRSVTKLGLKRCKGKISPKG